MIRSARIEGLFDKKESIVLKVEGALFILTGDNGSGKTTILNKIFNALNGNYEWFLNKGFKQMEIVFDENNKKLKKLILSKTPKGIDILFLLEIKTYQIHVEKVNTPSIEYPYRFSYLCKKPYEEEENNFFGTTCMKN